MKTYFLLIVVAAFSVTTMSCKTKKAAAASSATTSSSTSSPGVSGNMGTMETQTNTSTSGVAQGAHAGKVSHKYRTGGCETVIIIQAHDDVAEIVLIPSEKLNKDIDVDGQTITFDYQPLKMPQPAGCSVGIPAAISNVTKLK